VAYVENGDPGEEIDLAMGAHPEPNVPPQMARRLLLSGTIKVSDRRRFRPDHNFYAMADEIVAIEDDTVCLGKLHNERITSRS